MTNTLADSALSIWHASIDAVQADRLVASHIQLTEEQLIVADHAFDRATLGRVLVVGGGKAGTGMAAGLLSALPAEFILAHRVSGWINVPAGTEQTLGSITIHPARPAGVNEPTEAAVLGTHRILEQVSELQDNDLCICLISGGGSALLPALRKGISLDDKLAVTRWLSGAGANIEQMNTVRKQLSAVKGGRLAGACAGDLITLMISDVLGDPMDVIASGPTVPNPTTAEDACMVLAEFDPEKQLPSAVYRLLNDTPAAPILVNVDRVANEVIGNNATAVDAAGMRAEQLGFEHAMQSATKSEGEAEAIGRHLAKMAVQMLRDSGPNCLISGGEPVVRLVAEQERGRGGRNQQLVLAAMQWLETESDLSHEELAKIVILSGGTDGEDGPTDAAGAMLSKDVWARYKAADLDIAESLRRCDAYTFFDRCGGLVKTGPTGTNVCDIRIVAVER